MPLRRIPADQFRLLFENSLDAVFVTTPDGRVEAANNAACRMLGMTEAEVCAVHRRDIVDTTDLRLGSFLEERSRTGKARGELRLRKKCGCVFVGDATSVILEDGTRSFTIVRDITDKKKADEALRESERQLALAHRELQEVIDGAPATVIFVKDLEGRYITINRSLEKLLGISREEVKGKTDYDVFPPQYADRFREHDQQALAEGRQMHFEETAPKEGGGEYTFLASKFPLLDTAGKPYAVCGICMDITQRKLADRELARISDQRQLALDAAKMGWWHHDPMQRITRCDRRYREIFGVTEEMYPIEEFFKRLHPEDLPRVSAKIKAALDPAAPQPYMADYRIMRDGALRWVEAQGMAAFDGVGEGRKAVSLVGTVRDITDRKLAESRVKDAFARAEKLVQERTGELRKAVKSLSIEVEQRREAEAILRKSEAMLKTVLEALPVGVGIFDQAGRVTYLNTAAKKIWQGERYVPIEEFGQYRAWWHETGLPLQPEEWGAAQAVLYGKEVLGQVLEIETFSGSRKIIINSAAPIRDKDGALIGAVAVSEDVTAQIELHRQLLHSQKLESIGALAGGIAHDFNNLLMTICGYAELVYEELHDEDVLREDLRQVLIAGEKARDLTQKILVFSRQQVTETKVMSLSEAVRDVMKLLSRMLREDIEVNGELSDLPLSIRGNEAQIEQVLMNIVINAQDAMPAGGALTITTGEIPDPSGETPGSAYVKISDTGRGISKKYLDKVFDPYFTTKETGKGTGLGLSLAYGIVAQHQGQIAVKSAVGKGASFTISFPLAREEERKEAAAALPAGSETVLVVEDDDSVRSYLQVTLGKAGYRVLMAPGGADALRVVEEHPADIVVSDVIMPKMNGIEMFRQMKKIRPGIQVIFVSGYSSDILDSTGINRKRCRFLQKPVSRDILLQAVREMLDKKRREGE